VPKHDYDVGRALALLAEAGWTRGGDGQLRNAAGELLHVPLVSQNEDMDQQQATIVADNWKTIGVTPEVMVMTSGQQRDNEFRTKIAAVAYNNGPLGYDTMVWTRGQIPTSENRWRGNNPSYSNAALGEVWPRVLATYEPREREALLIDASTQMNSDAVINPLHSRPRAVAYRDGIGGPQQPWIGEAALIWNGWEFHWKAGAK